MANSKQRKTLEKLFCEDPGNNIRWADVESLLKGLGAELEEGSGSRVTITLEANVAVFHRPHPQPTIRRGVVAALRKFLQEAGVVP